VGISRADLFCFSSNLSNCRRQVEAELLSHPWVRLPVCFSVPSKVYGEEVGCAIVLNDDAPPGASEGDIVKSLRKWMKEKKFAPVKWPTKWWFGPDEDLPKTKTKKYIRVGLHAKLGFGDETEITDAPSSKIVKAKIDWYVFSSHFVRGDFIISCQCLTPVV
jgi:hypothetical protein